MEFDIMKAEADTQKQVRDQAEWLRRLADPATVVEAAQALWAMETHVAESRTLVQKSREHPDEDDAQRTEVFMPAMAILKDELDTLIPAWITRFDEQLRTMQQDRDRFCGAVAAGESFPAIDFGNICAVGQLQKALQSARERIDPHLGPIIKGLATLDRDHEEHLWAALEYAGPAVKDAVPRLLDELRDRGISRWPSHLAQALANASQFDDGVLVALCDILSRGDADARIAAMHVLGTIGPAARPAAGQLLQFRNGSEAERCGMIHALASQGTPTPEFLDVLEGAMRDENGYVRRSAANALGRLTPDPTRFVTLLIEACDWAEYLHDESLPEAAAWALGQYGARALAAVPRLRQFIEGPIKGRTLRADLVCEQLERISPSAAVPSLGGVRMRTEPLAENDPLFAVRWQDKQCYIDRQGQLVIQTRFSSGEPFSEGRAIVHDDSGRTFVIDRQGHDVFQSDWNEIRSFSEGLAAVRKDARWGFVDREGRVAIEPQFDSVTPFAEGFAGFAVGRTEERLRSGITRARYGRRGFIDRSGNVVIPAEWPDACSFRLGRAVVCTGGTLKPNPLLDGRELLSDRKYGYIDRMGRLLIPGDYDSAHSFSEGLAVMQYGRDICRARCGYIDVNGKQMIPPNWTWASWFKNGLALVHRRGRKWRGVSLVINRAGQVVLQLPYPIVEPFSEGLAAASSGEAFGFIDIEGHWAIEPQFDQIKPFQDGLAEVQRGDFYGLIDKSGSFVWGPTTEGSVYRVIDSEWTS
jgi:hypothetical protein